MTDLSFIPCDSIIIPPRDERQRKEIDTSDLEPSIAAQGVLVPIIVDRQNRLIAGERRLTTCLKLRIPSIPVHFIEDLPTVDAKLIEWTENAKRKDLTWQENVQAIAEIASLLAPITRQDLAEKLGVSGQQITRVLSIAEHLSDDKIMKMATLETAYNFIQRKRERTMADALAEIGTATREAVSAIEEISIEDVGEDVEPIDEPQTFLPVSAPKPLIQNLPISHRSLEIRPPESSIITADFCSWADNYSGPSFNFIHCDFPYGVNVFGGKQSGRETHHSYNDSEESYWTLLEALARNIDKLLGHSGHIMFWFGMRHYEKTLAFFRANMPDLDMRPMPLVWGKSCNTGILPDPRREPRNIYEVALFGSREDRFIVKPVANTYWGPTDRSLHPSAKPEPMLRHFFQMFVDENTRMLDPTCGSGSALRAAESLGADFVLGLEQDSEIAKGAQNALGDFRRKRKAAGDS